jgi:hypothetical protein
VGADDRQAEHRLTEVQLIAVRQRQDRVVGKGIPVPIELEVAGQRIDRRLLVGDILCTAVEQVARIIAGARDGVRSRKAEIASRHDGQRVGRATGRRKVDLPGILGERRGRGSRGHAGSSKKLEN